MGVMDQQILQTILAIVGPVATIATIRAQQSAQDARITRLELCEKDRPKEYVPRAEVEVVLRSIRDDIRLIRSWIRRSPAGEE